MQKTVRSWFARKAAMPFLALLVVASFTGSAAQAQSLQNVTYVGGTALSGTGMHGKVLVSSSDALVFEGKAKVTIPYDHVLSYESRVHRQVHVGLLTEGIWRLLAPWPEGKQLSLSYRDAENRPQLMVLRMSRGDEALLVEVLKTRVSRATVKPVLSVGHQTVLAQERTADH